MILSLPGGVLECESEGIKASLSSIVLFLLSISFIL